MVLQVLNPKFIIVLEIIVKAMSKHKATFVQISSEFLMVISSGESDLPIVHLSDGVA